MSVQLCLCNSLTTARSAIKNHVNARADDVLISMGYGMTEVVNRLQRMLGLRYPNYKTDKIKLMPENKPAVFISSLEHHSNHISWLETIADVEIIHTDNNDPISLEHLETLLKKTEIED